MCLGSAVMAATAQAFSRRRTNDVYVPTQDEPYIELPNGVIVDRMVSPPRPVYRNKVVAFDWAAQQAQVSMLLKKAELMYGCGLEVKARRQAVCRVIGVRLECSNTDCRKRYYRAFACRNRYCPICGPRLFGELLGKHLRRLSPVVDRMAGRRGYTVAKIDFTTRNLGVMPTSAQVKEFNACIKRFARAFEKKMGMKRKDYGLVYTDEFGGQDNTNLHAHGAYVGPVVPRQWCTGKGGVLSEMWRKACEGGDFAGSFIVSLKAARFEVALAHSLKYAGKFLSGDPERLAALEIAFHRVRRVHSMGVFF